MPVPYTFGTATAAIPLSQLDSNFSTAVTIGNTAVQLGNTVTTLNNITLANVTVSSGNSTVTKETVTTITSPTATNLTLQSAGTTAVTIDTSQNVGIGTSSPSTKLHVMSASSALSFALSPSNSNTNIGYVINDSTYLSFASGYGTTGVKFRVALAAPDNAATIDSSGNVGIGTSSAGQKLTVATSTNFQMRIGDSNATGVYDIGRNSTSGLLTFYGNQTTYTGYVFSGVDGERMRIDSSGNLLVGTTSANGRLTVTGVDSTGSNFALNTRNSGNNQLLAIRNDGYANFGTQSTAPYNFGVSSSTKAMYMDSSGGLGFNSSIRASKININKAPSSDWINNLDIVTFNYRKKNIDGTYTEEAENELRWGVIAEDAEVVAKDFCSYDSNGSIDGFNYDRLVPVLVKAIQEQQALIIQLQADVAALKGTA